MDATSLIAFAGIAGTLAAAVLTPLIAGRAQRAALRQERILERRLDTYVDLLETASHLHANAQTWSAIPLADLKEPPTDRLRSIDARVRAVGSQEVLEAMLNVSRLFASFSRELFPAQLRHRRNLQDEEVDTVEAIAARLGLGRIADEVTMALDALESRIRAEVKI